MWDAVNSSHLSNTGKHLIFSIQNYFLSSITENQVYFIGHFVTTTNCLKYIKSWICLMRKWKLRLNAQFRIICLS